MDESLTGTYSNRFAKCVEGLLVDHVRLSFREDERKLKSTNQRIDQVQANAREAESRLRHRAMSRLEKLRACSERLAANCENLTAEIQKLEEDRNKIRSLLDRGSSDHWSDLERAAARLSVDAALSDAAQEIAKCERQIETLLNRREQLVQDEHAWASSKNAGEDLLASLISGGEPTPYQKALTEDRTSLEAEFQRASDDV